MEEKQLFRRRTMVLALMIDASAESRRTFTGTRLMAERMLSTYIDYDDVRPLLSKSFLVTADEERLSKATYGLLCQVAATQLSFGRGAFVVAPVKSDEYRAHLDGLSELADSHGVPFVVVEIRGETEAAEESWGKISRGDLPHLVLSFVGSEYDRCNHLRYPVDLCNALRRFLDYFDRLPEFIGDNCRRASDPTKFRHFSHPCQLEFGSAATAVDHCCCICSSAITGLDYYSCSSCSFFLHKSCVELPQHIESPIHSYPLRLVIRSWEKSGHCLFTYSRHNRGSHIKCILCESGDVPQPFYGCWLCEDLFVHYKCIASLRDVIEHRLHPHPIKMETVQVPSENHLNCYACGGAITNVCYSCRECKFDFHLKCALNLPNSVSHERHKGHPLVLSRPLKDETDEYYCEVCAERRHPDYWIYYCKKCEYEAHPHCVIEGIAPYTYEEETNTSGIITGDEAADDDYNI